MVEELGFDLRSKKFLTGCITVKIKYSDFNTVTKQKSIAYTSLDEKPRETAIELFEKLYDKRLLIRLVSVRLSHLVHRAYQIDLFNDTATNIKLYEALDKIRIKFGSDKMKRVN